MKNHSGRHFSDAVTNMQGQKMLLCWMTILISKRRIHIVLVETIPEITAAKKYVLVFV
jgi:hypothetical protein